MIKNPLANAGDTRDLGSVPGWGSSLEKEMATYSYILACKSHGWRNLVGLSQWGCRVRHS